VIFFRLHGDSLLSLIFLFRTFPKRLRRPPSISCTPHTLSPPRIRSRIFFFFLFCWSPYYIPLINFFSLFCFPVFFQVLPSHFFSPFARFSKPQNTLPATHGFPLVPQSLELFLRTRIPLATNVFRMSGSLSLLTLKVGPLTSVSCRPFKYKGSLAPFLSPPEGYPHVILFPRARR